MRLEGKTAVVTGAGSGIGKSIAELCAREGARVAVLDIRGDTANTVVKSLHGNEHIAVEVDVADSDSVSEAFASVDRSLGGLDVLVNNAGVDRVPNDGFDETMRGEQQILHMDISAFRRMFAINVEGVFSCTREAVRLMQNHDVAGAIVNMSSMAALNGQGLNHYAATKAAVLGFTRSTARQLGRIGIRVNAVCPGVIDTPMTAAVPEAALKGLLGATPLGRIGQPEDIAQAVLYLASEQSGFVTGQWLSPNGGLVMC
jgi:3-oxoacyl-[acyl-carrier protein] reductase